MNFPDQPIRILGIPWRIEVVDLIDNDVTAGSEIKQCECIIVLAAENTPARMRWHSFWGVLAALQVQLVDPNHRNLSGSIDTMHQAIWTGIRDNWPAVRTWFGLDHGEPAVIDGTRLRLCGMDYVLKRPHRMPGRDLGYYGLCETDDCVIQVRQGLSPHHGAVTALHELMHGCSQSLDPLWNNELFIGPMSVGLAQIFFDNSEWMEFIFGGVGHAASEGDKQEDSQ